MTDTTTTNPAPPGEGLTPYAGGVVKLVSNRQLEAEKRRKAEAGQQKTYIQSISQYVDHAWEEAKSERQRVEQRMMESLRQRRGEYEPDKLQAIREQGGAEIYMMLTSVKCRAASSWLRDTLGGSGDGKPWTLRPTPLPELPPQAHQAIQNRVHQEIQQFLLAGGMMPSQEMIDNAKLVAQDRLKAEQQKAARRAMKACEDKMEDQLVEGGFVKALDQFCDDIVTLPAAFLKGPVIRRKPKLTWGDDGEPVVEETLKKEWDRVSALYIYPSPQSEGIDDGYLFERHKLSRTDITELKGVEGYDDNAIDMVLEEYHRGGLNEWLSIDTGANSDEEVKTLGIQTAAATIDALQFWGDVPGKYLSEWGLEVEDEYRDYQCEVWKVGRWVIKATLNPDPLKRRPYFKASYEEVPGQFWGHSVADLVRDTQNVCNAAARALVNNMGIASGPQVWTNVDRLPDGEEVTQLFPWKIWQSTSDPMGGSGAPMGFFQPSSLAGELMAVYEKFSELADEYSGVPKYMTGADSAPGAGRTASGMSMMMSNAGKAIKQVLSSIDVNVFTPLLETLFYHNMRYSDDAELKNGDICIVARGASGLIAKETAQVRINEFLNMSIGSQLVYQIIGPEGVATLLREGAKQLDLDVDKIIPSEEMIKANQLAQQAAAMAQQQQQQALQEAALNQPIENIEFNRTPEGEITGARVMPGPQAAVGNGQQLMDGAPVTDNFQPTPQR